MQSQLKHLEQGHLSSTEQVLNKPWDGTAGHKCVTDFRDGGLQILQRSDKKKMMHGQLLPMNLQD